MKSLVLLSGGIDSAVCLAMLRGHERAAVHFSYRPDHENEYNDSELYAAVAFARNEGVDLETADLPDIPLSDDIVFAGRNAILLAQAASVAITTGCNRLVIGCNADDEERFPDCRAIFIDGMDQAFSHAYGIRVHAPLLTLKKHEVIQRAWLAGIDINQLWSCYHPEGEEPCGNCYACEIRESAVAVIA